MSAAPEAGTVTRLDAGLLARILRRRWLTIVLTVGATVAAAGFLSILRSPEYEAANRLLVMPRGGDPQGSLVAEQRVKSYAALATTDAVLQGVIDELGLQTEADLLRRRVAATVEPDTLLLVVQVRATTPAEAIALADALGGRLQSLAASLEQGAGSEAVTGLRPIDRASQALEPNARPLGVMLFVGAAVGLVLAVGAALVRHALDRRVRSADDLLRYSVPVAGLLTDRSGLPPKDGAALNERLEPLRLLRLKMLEWFPPGHGVCIVVSTVGGGPGSNQDLIWGLTAVCAEAGERVVVVDAHVRGRPPQQVREPQRNGAVAELTAAVDCGRTILRRGVQLVGGGTLVNGVTPQEAPSSLLRGSDLSDVLHGFRSQADLVLLDCPPVMAVTDSAALARHADATVLIVPAKKTRKSELRAAVERLNDVGARKIAIVLSRAESLVAEDVIRMLRSESRASANGEADGIPRRDDDVAVQEGSTGAGGTRT